MAENQIYYVGNTTTRLSTWARFKRTVADWWQDVKETSGVVQLLCCIDVAELENYRQDERIRGDIRSAMRTQMGYNGGVTCVAGAIRAAEAEGYHMVRSEAPVPMLEAEGPIVNPQARIIPKFAAAVCLHLKAKFGHLSRDEANMLVVQRDYLKICREHGVRDVDIASHRQFVLNAFFTEDVMEHIALTRTRAPKWMRRREAPSLPAKPQVC